MSRESIRIRSCRDQGCDLHLCKESYCYFYTTSDFWQTYLWEWTDDWIEGRVGANTR